MDPTAFDTLTRAFTTPGSRRRLLRLASALLPAGLLAARREAASAAERNRQPRNNNQNNNQNNNNQNNNNQNNNNQNNNNQNRNKGKGQDPVCTVGQICGQPSTCGNGCFCLQSVEGTNFCIQFAANNCEPRCTSSTECAGDSAPPRSAVAAVGKGKMGLRRVSRLPTSARPSPDAS